MRLAASFFLQGERDRAETAITFTLSRGYGFSSHRHFVALDLSRVIDRRGKVVPADGALKPPRPVTEKLSVARSIKSRAALT